jgi:hypothetical protein
MKRVTAMFLAGLIAMVAPAFAQTSPKDPPKGPISKVVQGAYSPERINSEIEGIAKKRTDPNPAPRGRFFTITYAENANEFAGLRRYSVMLLTAISQKSEELPLKRVFIRANGQDVPLQKILSWRSDVGAGTLAHKIYGPYREDAYYLIPTGMMVREGQMMLDHAANAANVNFLQLPSTAAPEATKNFSNLDPEPNSKPDLKMLQALIARKFPGFPVPKSVP